MRVPPRGAAEFEVTLHIALHGYEFKDESTIYREDILSGRQWPAA